MSCLCIQLFNSTFRADTGFALYHISYLFYTLIGASVTIIVALIVSFVVGPNDVSKVDEKHFATFIRPYILRKKQIAGVKPDVLEVKEIVSST